MTDPQSHPQPPHSPRDTAPPSTELQEQLSSLIEGLHRRRAQGTLTAADEDVIGVLRRANPLIAEGKRGVLKRKAQEKKAAREAAAADCGIRRLRHERYAHNSALRQQQVNAIALASTATPAAMHNGEQLAPAAVGLPAADTETAAMAAQHRQQRPSRPPPAADATPACRPSNGTSQGQRQKQHSIAKCYICKKEIEELHAFYDRMCCACGDANYNMRSLSCSLAGKRAVVTGGRIKIGFEIALKLLRAGAEVLVTTRFPRDARMRFLAQPDAASWRERLHLYQLDLLSLEQVGTFTSHVCSRWASLDIFICNAAQTIRRPADFYELPLRLEYPSEAAALGVRQALPSIASVCDHGGRSRPALSYGGPAARHALSNTEAGAGAGPSTGGDAMTASEPPAKRAKDGGGAAPAALSSPRQVSAQRLLRPHDEHGQPLETRPRNTWDTRLLEVPLVEAAECAFINYLSPFALLQGLYPAMQRSQQETPACAVLVSAMEGKFNDCAKRVAHPHTNAAKAALNMLVRTSAADFAASANILLTAVDTGWVTDEFAKTDAARGVDHPPLDEIDGAARVLHPVFAAYNPAGPKRYSGVFLKDYAPASW